MKRILFNLKREWYDKIASGEKTVKAWGPHPFLEINLRQIGGQA